MSSGKALGLLIAVLTAPLFAATPVPKATLIPATAESYPFGAANHTRVPEDLSKIGYVEEEFLLSGTANVYDWPKPESESRSPAVVRTAGAPYTTRVIVRRPKNQ